MKVPKEQFVLRKHHLAHVPELGVEKGFLNKNFALGCSMQNCNAKCCREGVWLDPTEQKKILDHQGLIQRHMEPHQDKNPDSWFDNSYQQDADFPSGQCLGTQTRSYGCIFLDSVGRCTLQKAATAEGLPKFFLKPFFCVAYPLAIEEGVLAFDDADFANRPECCSVVKGGEQSVFDVCLEELEYVLGKEGVEELRQHEKDPLPKPPPTV